MIPYDLFYHSVDTRVVWIYGTERSAIHCNTNKQMEVWRIDEYAILENLTDNDKPNNCL